MRLPETISTPAGLSVEGASPELLAELLNEFELVCAQNGFDLTKTMTPGLSRQKIIDLWAEQDLEAPEEAIVAWSWHNGRSMSGQGYPGLDQAPIEQSANRYARIPKGDGSLDGDGWNPAWIVLWGGTPDGISIDTTPTSGPPLIRATSGLLGTGPDETEHQVVSFCTPITWWLVARQEGWTIAEDNPTAPGRRWAANYDAIPRAWFRTQLAHM